MNQPLKNRIAVVTGATRQLSIGAATCYALAEAGADIFFTHWASYDKKTMSDFDKNDPERIKKNILLNDVRCIDLSIDLKKDHAETTILNEVAKALGEPSILVNNAAYSSETSFGSLTNDELYKHYAVNVKATTMLSCTFAERFSKGAGGRVINLTSGQSLGPMPGELAYATTKGAVESLTLTLSAEVAHKGITVNAVNPGPTDTGWMNGEVQQYLNKKFTFGRVGKPEDAARLIRFLATDEAEWITGQVINSEGGFLRQ